MPHRSSRRLHPPCPSPAHRVVHFDIPTADGREIFSVDRRGKTTGIVPLPRGSNGDQLAAGLDDGPMIVVVVDKDGNYSTEYGVPGQPFRSIGQLVHTVIGVHWPIHCPDLSPSEEEHVGGTASSQTLQQPNVSSLKELLNTTTLEESSITATSSSSKQDTIWVRKEYDWGIKFYTRIDHSGYFHTYPLVGGPFQSLREAYSTIDCYLRDRLDPTMEDEVSRVEMAVWRTLYWPDGTRKARLKSLPIDESRCWMLQLVRALVDKYNDDHNLLGDVAYELKDVVRYVLFHDDHSDRRYSHINFTAKTKGADDCGSYNLFFTEVTSMRGEPEESVVSCICMVNPFDNGRCYACANEVKHPKVDAYTGGHSEGGLFKGCSRPFAGPKKDLGKTAADLEAEEAWVRYLYKDLDDPLFMEEFMAPNPQYKLKFLGGEED